MCTFDNFLLSYTYFHTLEHDESSSAESDGTSSESSNYESEPGGTFESGSIHIDNERLGDTCKNFGNSVITKPEEKSDISRSPGQKESESSMTAKVGCCRVISGKQKSRTTKNPRKKNSESSKTTETHGSAETTGQSQEKSSESNSQGQEDSDISTSAETHERTEINEQNQEKGDDNSSPGQGDSDSSMTGHHQVISGKVKSRMTKNPRKKNSESSKTTETHGSAETTGQSQEKSSDSNSPGQEDSDITTSAETHESKETNEQNQEESEDNNSPGQEDSDISMSAETHESTETNEQNQEKGDDNSSPGQGDSESSMTGKVGCCRVISGKVKSCTTKHSRKKNSESSKTSEAHGSAETLIVLDETRKNNDDCTSRCRVGSEAGKKRSSEEITFPVKRAPLGICVGMCTIYRISGIVYMYM